MMSNDDRITTDHDPRDTDSDWSSLSSLKFTFTSIKPTTAGATLHPISHNATTYKSVYFTINKVHLKHSYSIAKSSPKDELKNPEKVVCKAAEITNKLSMSILQNRQELSLQ